MEGAPLVTNSWQLAAMRKYAEENPGLSNDELAAGFYAKFFCDRDGNFVGASENVVTRFAKADTAAAAAPKIAAFIATKMRREGAQGGGGARGGK
jgi:hypothetical protein